MFTGSEKDRRMVAHMQAEMRRQAEEHRLAQEAREDREFSFLSKRWVVIGIVVVMVVLSLFGGYLHANAQETVDPGSGEPFGEAMLAYRLGNYYFVAGDYERAVVEFTRAIELMPEEVFIKLPEYSEMYWALGEAQERAGMEQEALVSYHQFLTLAGDTAALWTVEYVQQLESHLEETVVKVSPA